MQKIIFIKSKNYSLEELYLNAAAFRHRQFSWKLMVEFQTLITQATNSNIFSFVFFLCFPHSMLIY